MNKIDRIIAYESGELNDKNTLKLFAELIKTRQAWALQGHYGRTARALIQDKWISQSGKINKEKFETLG